MVFRNLSAWPLPALAVSSTWPRPPNPRSTVAAATRMPGRAERPVGWPPAATPLASALRDARARESLAIITRPLGPLALLRPLLLVLLRSSASWLRLAAITMHAVGRDGAARATRALAGWALHVRSPVVSAGGPPVR